jgi:hypothetical protein
VEQRDGWRDTLLDHLTNNAIIMSHRLTIHGDLSEWKDSRPADARTEAGNPKGLQARKILLLVIVVFGDCIASAIIRNLVGHSVRK